MKWRLILYRLTILTFFVSGCDAGQINTTPLQKQTESIPLPIETQTLPALKPTQTPTMTATALRSSITPSPTMPNTHTSTATPTPFPTLNPEQASEMIISYLQDGGKCVTPCFLDILPGKTTSSQAEDILANLGFPIRKATYPDQNFGINYSLDNGLSFNTQISIQEKVVKNLEIRITTELLTAGSARSWKIFSPETLIQKYGQPSNVTISTDWGPNSLFVMDVYFSAVDLIVEYSGINIYPKKINTLTVCPIVMPFDSVWVWMGKEPSSPPWVGVPLEKASTLTLAEFAKLITGNAEKACFSVDTESVSPHLLTP